MISRLTWILLLLGSLSWVRAQDRGAIEGTVSDQSGAAVPSAKVQIVQVDTNTAYNVSSNEVGRYYVPGLPLGQYRIIAQKEGFSRATREPVEVRSQTNARVDIVLSVGDVSQNVDVHAEAELLDTATTTRSASLTTKYIEDLPLIAFGNKADITSYARYLPATGGTQGLTSEVFVDGAPSSTGVSRGSIGENGGAVTHYGEFNIVSNSFSAEYGRTGTSFVSVTVKAGTNDLHGGLYDFFVNDALNARDFFQAKRQIYRQNNGGYTLGGPVVLPRLYNGRNRTFFFFGHDLFYSRGAQSGTLITIPPLAFRTGDFSNYRAANGTVIPIFDPDSADASGVRTQFPGNIIPSNRISAASKNIIALMPAPDLPTQSANWHNRTGANPQFNIFSITGRVDHNFSDTEKIAVSYTDEYRPRKIAGLGWGADSPLEGLQEQPLHSRTGRINYTSIFRPTLLNQLTIGIDRYLNPAFASTIGQNWNSKLGIKGMPFDIGSFPTVSFTGGTDSPITMGIVQSSNLGAGRYTLGDSLTWIRGHHFMKFGGNIWREYRNDFARANGSGAWTYTNQITSQPNVAQSAQWGSSFASFLLGAPGTAFTRGPTYLSTRLPYQALFFQDEWHVSQKLSLSLGIRWEYNSPANDKYDRLANFSPTTPNPGAGNIPGALVFSGTGPGTINARTTVQPWRKGFAPRIGYAYQINKKLVMRSSIGIFYAAPALNALTLQGWGSQATFSSPDGFAPAYRWDNNFPSFQTQVVIDPTVLNGQVIHWYAPDYDRNAQILSWTAGFQYELTPNTLLDASYLGSHGTHLEAAGFLGNPNVLDPKYLALGSLLTQNINSAAAQAAGIKLPWAGFSTFSLNTVGQALRAYPQYLDVYNFGAKVGISRYNSLQVKVNRRLSKGLTLTSSYTWTKNLTNVPTLTANATGTSPANAQNPYDRASEVAVSDIPHELKISFSYDLPFGKGKAFVNRGGFMNQVVGGWQIVGFVQRASGAALAITASNNLSTFGFQTKRANLVSGQPLTINTDSHNFDPAKDRYINSAAFVSPAAFSLGNTARALDWLRGWPAKTESLSATKSFALRERVNMKFSVDLDNPFNFVRWTTIVTAVNASNFGATTASAAGRRIQLTFAMNF